jgi:hypothetical protein
MNDVIPKSVFENPKKILVTPIVEIISSTDINNYSISHNYEHIVFDGGTKLFYGS